MTKTFNDLKVGDKIFVDKMAKFIHRIEIKNGYLAIQTTYSKNEPIKPWFGRWYYIPVNHLKGNKIKLKNHIWIHLTERGYKKYMNEFIKKQIEL